MATIRERKRRAEEILKKQNALTGNDSYASAVDLIADLLLVVAQSANEATQVLNAAEDEFRCQFELEQIISEG